MTFLDCGRHYEPDLGVMVRSAILLCDFCGHREEGEPSSEWHFYWGRHEVREEDGARVVVDMCPRCRTDHDAADGPREEQQS